MYYLLLIIFYPISLLPLWVLYGISDFACFILYNIMGYRKEVVRDNLTHAFPEKSADEIEAIMRRFYRSFCDQWIETVKLLSMSNRSLNKRMTGNWEVLQQLGEEGKNTYLLTGHTYNWEWANAAVALNTPQSYACVYLPLSSKGFDKLMLRIRERTGTRMISMKALKSGFKSLLGKQHILGLAGDQNPAVVEVAEWIPFMHREAPFFRGPEMMPRRAKAAVVLIGIRKVKRGYYRAYLERICDDASLTAPGEILKRYVNFIETQLHAQPENYLWSHRRWKHKRKTGPQIQ
jgi:KDO2-lipid IV(A) lauroyltransferase